jgi:archaemetzincin
MLPIFRLRCCPWSMRLLIFTVVGCLALVSVNAMSHSGMNSAADKLSRQLQALARKLKPLHAKMGPSQPGDWLESHPERGQTFQQYLRSRPVKLTEKRNVLYVLPLGEFDPEQRKIIDLSAEFLGLYFGCPVKTMETVSLDDVIPATARRVHPSWGVRQIKSTYVLDKVLPQRLPDDAVALIAFTSIDLYPNDDWNFVFGQASLRDRVGVWSIFRNGDPKAEFKTCLKRTLQTATHETGHMFSIAHCTAYECNMCGSNNRAESDRRPLYLCPECVAKIWWATGSNPLQRYESLKAFCQRNGLSDEVDFFSKSIELIK